MKTLQWATMLSLAATVRGQFAGGFSPSNAPYGGFGGGSCTSTHTPIIFLHGNGNNAQNWFDGVSQGAPNPVATFQNAGYTPCDLFGVTWLSTSAQAASQAQYNYHEEGKAKIVSNFIADVLSYTGKSKVVIIGHSMGVTVGLHGITYENQWGNIDTFLSIAGAMKGLDSCLAVGYANAYYPTCGSQNVYDSNVFGFYPSQNPRMQSGGFRDYPSQLGGVTFYSINAGTSDEIICSTGTNCQSSVFDSSSNIHAQINVGYGSPSVNGNDDSSGVGHFRAKRNTGAIQVNMILNRCSGTGCCSGYSGPTCATS
ncbi:hypothetical protein BZG36_02241 [Bifiguratus adelaidae]|uniref:AB hydrolase-1 domain-containing protein n=1 Tax=Bifiguratus adelaidae TaxID=1938954 RepID=A0A261Y1N4_9FUNG|nr:hypothetical protein BZG36_02241 [Bifiguratus adelaidae]